MQDYVCVYITISVEVTSVYLRQIPMSFVLTTQLTLCTQEGSLWAETDRTMYSRISAVADHEEA